MPFFDYVCERCDRQFERRVQSSRSRVSCASCGSARTRRLPPLVGIRGSSPPAPTICTGDDSCPPSGCGLIERCDRESAAN